MRPESSSHDSSRQGCFHCRREELVQRHEFLSLDELSEKQRENAVILSDVATCFESEIEKHREVSAIGDGTLNLKDIRYFQDAKYIVLTFSNFCEGFETNFMGDFISVRRRDGLSNGIHYEINDTKNPTSLIVSAGDLPEAIQREVKGLRQPRKRFDLD